MSPTVSIADTKIAVFTLIIQWNSSITDTIRNQHFVPYIEVGVVLRNRAVEHNMAVFSELHFAVRWQGMLSRG